MRMRPRLFLITCALALSGCAPTIETRVSNSGQKNVEKLAFMLAPTEKTASSELLMARDLVVTKLKTNGYEAQDTAPYYLEVGVSARPASLALLEANKTIAAASPKRPSRKCPLQEYRVSVALTRISDGAVMYRASAGEYHCKAALANTLPALVGHALTDLGNPRGDYIVKAKVK
jgi:hypothetical protein